MMTPYKIDVKENNKLVGNSVQANATKVEGATKGMVKNP